MTIQKSTSSAWETRVHYVPIPGEPGVWSTTYIGANASCGEPPAIGEHELYPMAYLVEFEPDSNIKPHFHVADQFQLVVAGSGIFGKRVLRDLSFHYSSAYTTYGPIRAQEDGLGYFTLRNRWDAGALWMPQSRDKLRSANRTRREVVSPNVDRGDVASLRSLTQIDCLEMVSEPDGLGGWYYRLPSEKTLVGPPHTGLGQFCVILSGTAMVNGEPMDKWSCSWVAPTEPAFAVTAGETGAEVILLQFPKREDA